MNETRRFLVLLFLLSLLTASVPTSESPNGPLFDWLENSVLSKNGDASNLAAISAGSLYSSKSNSGIVISPDSYADPEFLLKTREGHTGLDTENIASGFIVELKESPLIQIYKNNVGRQERQGSSYSLQSLLQAQTSKITKEQTSFLSQLPASVKSKNKLPLKNPTLQNLDQSGSSKRFTKLVNAIVLDMDGTEAAQVAKIKSVKRIEPRKKVQATLRESVPMIGADPKSLLSNTSVTLTGAGVKIAIIDTGVDYTHPDLGGCFGKNSNGNTCKVAGGYDFVNGDADPMDDNGHGTHVAATAAGNGSLKGVAPGAEIYAYKVLDINGSGTSENIIAAIEKAVDPNGDGVFSDRLDVINLSLGGDGDPDDLMSKAVDNVVAAGVTAVVAAGNSGPSEQTVGSPGSARDAITVGATDKSDVIADFSSRGPVKWKDSNGNFNYLIKPDVMAPGVQICAARYAESFPKGDTNCNSDNNHVAINGTSMAAPHVAGTVALFLENHKDWSPEEIKSALRQTADLTKINYRNHVGYGRINVSNFIRSNRPPIAKLSPLGVSIGIIDIKGTATSREFRSYSVLYGKGRDPAVFEVMSSSNRPIQNGILASLDTNKLDEGLNTIKLVVSDFLGGKSQDDALIEVNNMEITSVGDTSNYINGGVKPIRGFINVPGASDWRIVARNSESRNILCSDTRGKISPIKGVLCSPNFDGLPNGLYNIYLEVLQGDTWKSDITSEFVVVKELLNNWPQKLELSSRSHAVLDTEGNSLSKQLVLGNVGGCIVGKGVKTCSPWILKFYKSDGSVALETDILGYPSLFTYYYDSARGGQYIIMNTGNWMDTGIVVDKRGGALASWINEKTRSSPAVVFDRDGDGMPEIYSAYISYETKKLKIEGRDFDGRLLKNFPLSIDKFTNDSIPYSSFQFSFLRSVSSTSVDQNLAVLSSEMKYDGEFVRNLAIRANIFSKDNALISNSVIFEGAQMQASGGILPPLSVDFDRDGNMEWVIAYGVVDTNLYKSNISGLGVYKTYIQVLDNRGRLKKSFTLDGHLVSKIAIGDLGYGSPSIVAVLDETFAENINGAKIVALDGELNTKLEIFEKDYGGSDNFITGLSIGDVDGDNDREIILGYRYRWLNGPFGIQIFSNRGLFKRDIKIPTMTGFYQNTDGEPVVMDDFNGDGNADVVLQSLWENSDDFGGGLYALNLGGKYDSKNIDWKTTFHDDQRTACFGCDFKPPILNLSANPTSTILNGSSTISWASKNTSYCNKFGGWSGNGVATSSSEIVTGISTTTTYSLTCSGNYGSSTAHTTVSVVSMDENIKSLQAIIRNLLDQIKSLKDKIDAVKCERRLGPCKP